MSKENTNTIADRVMSYQYRRKFNSIITSPTFVWFATLYIVALINIIVLNTARVGPNGLFGTNDEMSGPEYFNDLFLHFGLNNDSTYASPHLDGFTAWLTAPLFAVFLGFALFMLTDAGLAYNADFDKIEAQTGDDLTDPIGVRFYAFFKDPVFSYDIHYFGHKVNLFYLALVWVPIGVATITTLLVKKRQGRESSIPTRFAINFIIGIFIGNAVARMSDPNLHYNLSGFFESLFVDRNYNHFVVYDGFYFPTVIAFFIALIQIIPMIILLFAEGLYYAKIALQKQLAYNKQVKLELDNLRKDMAIEGDLLPWELEQDAAAKEAEN